MAQVSKVHAHVTTDVYPTSAPRRGAILVVEDRDDLRLGMAQLLELHGFVVRDAADGERALEELLRAPAGFALILLDLLLPGRMSGRDLRERQLSDADASLVPTVVVSSCEPDDVIQAQLRPAAWLEKPFRVDALLSVVRQHVLPEWEDAA